MGISLQSLAPPDDVAGVEGIWVSLVLPQDVTRRQLNNKISMNVTDIDFDITIHSFIFAKTDLTAVVKYSLLLSTCPLQGCSSTLSIIIYYRKTYSY
jgi:hypothetical protein